MELKNIPAEGGKTWHSQAAKDENAQSPLRVE